MKSRSHRMLNRFSRSSKNSRLDQVMFRNIKTVDANANGTSGYLLKKGKNSGKILKHLKKETKNI